MDKIKLYEIASSYVGTPHVNAGMIKKAGVDCSTLPALIFEEMGYGPYNIELNYTGDWYIKQNPDRKLEAYLEKYCNKIEENELRAGDIIAYQYGRAVSHLSLLLDDEKEYVIHCHAMRGTEITEYDDPIFKKGNGKSRAVSYWRIKEVG